MHTMCYYTEAMWVAHTCIQTLMDWILPATDSLAMPDYGIKKHTITS